MQINREQTINHMRLSSYTYGTILSAVLIVPTF